MQPFIRSFLTGWPEQSRSKLHPFTKFDPRETHSANSNNNNSSKKITQKIYVGPSSNHPLSLHLIVPEKKPRRTNKHRIVSYYILDNWRLIDQQLLPYKFYGCGMACKKSAFYILFLHPWFMISHKVNARSHTHAHIPAWHPLIFLYYFLTCFSCIVLACLDGTSYQYPCPALILQTNSKQITI